MVGREILAFSYGYMGVLQTCFCSWLSVDILTCMSAVAACLYFLWTPIVCKKHEQVPLRMAGVGWSWCQPSYSEERACLSVCLLFVVWVPNWVYSFACRQTDPCD